MEELARISPEHAKALGRRLYDLRPAAEDFLDPRFYPDPSDHPEQVIRFFFFTTAIDHRTSPPGQSFEGLVDGEYFQGADLLWHLSLRMYHKDPEFFSPSRMSCLSASDVRQWLTVTNPARVTIRNPEQRAQLLNDCGQKLLQDYGGSVLTLLSRSRGRLHPPPNNPEGPGLLKLLSHFQAYEDPASKKSFLLVKFLTRRRLWAPQDPENLLIPVDNHLTRIALRTGIVEVSPKLEDKLRQGIQVNREEDITLRRVIARAYSSVAVRAQRSVLELDDFFWHFGRNCCTAQPPPVCIRSCSAPCYLAEHLIPEFCQFHCPLEESCPASSDDNKRALMEPRLDTWYY